MLIMVNVANLSHCRECVAVSHVALIYISLTSNNMNVFSFICLSSLVNCLLKFLPFQTLSCLPLLWLTVCSNSCHFNNWAVYLFIKELSKIFTHSTYQFFVRNIFCKYFKFLVAFLYLIWAIWIGNFSQSHEVQCIGFSPFLAQDLCLTKYFPNQDD